MWPLLMEKNKLSIKFAHRTFQWSNDAKGEAAVHCVIIGLTRSNPKIRRLFDYSTPKAEPVELQTPEINPYLTNGPSVIVKKSRNPISERPIMKCGSKPSDGGNLILSEEEKAEIVVKYPELSQWIKPYVGSHEFINGGWRWCLWLDGIPAATIRKYRVLVERIDAVRKFREASTAKPTRAAASTPARFFFVSQPNTEYIVIPEVSSERRKYIPIGCLGPDVISSNKIYLIPSSDLFLYGVLQSSMHMSWTRAVCGRLKSDYQYSGTIVYNNFPLPIDANEKLQGAISAAAQGVLDARTQFIDATLADLYDPVSMPPALVKAHQALDRAVDAAYVPSGGKRTWATEAERVAFLFEQYQKVTSLLQTEKPKNKRRK